MYVSKRSEFDNSPAYDIVKDNVRFTISYGGNGDLYWMFKDLNKPYSEDINDIITMKIYEEDNYYIYKALDNLYNAISKAYVWKPDGTYKIMNEPTKEISHYYELYKDGIINWESDDTDCYLIGNVSIIKEKDCYKLVYKEKINKKGFYTTTSSIRFRNERSYYFPFNMLFMDMYNWLNKVEDPNQMTIEQYIKIKEKVKFK